MTGRLSPSVGEKKGGEKKSGEKKSGEKKSGEKKGGEKKGGGTSPLRRSIRWPVGAGFPRPNPHRPNNVKALVLLFLFTALAVCRPAPAAGTGVTFALGDRGLRSLQYNGTELLWAVPSNGRAIDGSEFFVSHVIMSKLGSADVSLDQGGPSKVTTDPTRGLVMRTFDWGSVRGVFAAQGSRLNLTITVTNTTRDQAVKAVYLQPLWLKFPTKPHEYDGGAPILAANLGQPSVVSMDYGTGTLALCNEDVTRPLLIGFPYALDNLGNTTFPLQVSSGPTDWLHPYIDPYLQRPIAPGHSDTYTLSLRFGPAGTKAADLAADLYRTFAAKYPPTLRWADRRPIGYLMLSSSVPHPASGKNPRGWFNNDANVDVTTPEGRAAFGKQLMAYADGSIQILKDMNAQGAITWDIQGQEYPHATSYIGDPRLTPTLAPEIDPFADAYFQKFRDAGLRVGVCLRPETFVKTPTGASQQEMDLSKPEAIAQTLIDRARYASKRWGCTLFYVDSNGDPNVPYDAGIFQRVAETLAKEGVKVLLMPEHKNPRYYAYTAPYTELRLGHASTPDDARRIYPHAFSVINIADGPLDERHDEVLAAVKRGDILLFRAWFPDPYNAKGKAIYKEAEPPPK